MDALCRFPCGLLLCLMICRSSGSDLAFVYDGAGRLTGARYDSVTNLVFQYDYCGSLLQENRFVGSAGDLSVSMALLPATPAAGVPFLARITAQNLAGQTLNAVTLSADLPVNWTLLRVSSSVGQAASVGSQVTLDLTGLPGGTEAALLITARVLEPGPQRITATGAGAGDPNPGNNTTTLEVNVTDPPALAFAGSLSQPGASVLSWSAEAGPLELEETESLSPPVLWDRSGEAGLFGGRYQLQIIPDFAGNRFYRLRLAQ